MIELGKKGVSISGVSVMKGKELTPSPYQSFPAETFPQKPLLSKDGSVLIYEKSESGDFYLYSEGSKHRYVGGGGSVNSAAISPDGELLGMIVLSKSIHISTVQDGNQKQILYLSCAPKTIENFEIYMRKRKDLHRMIPDTPSRIFNR